MVNEIERKYSAFISYRHKDVDVATSIQRAIERFRIPNEVRKTTGVKKFKRVFRDEEELTAGGELTESLKDALRASDNLIVICSEETKNSEWVKFEVETFIELHGRKKIYPILAGKGTSKELIPDFLRYEKVVDLDESGNTVSREIEHHTLSCDYRDSAKNPEKTQFPKVAAAMLGCDYDDLVRRLQQYKTRRFVVLFSVILAVLVLFGSYMTYSLIRFRKDYRETLRQESLILAEQSATEFENFNRIGAVELALQALPNEDIDRPIVPEAMLALSNASLAYTVPNVVDIQNTWIYEAGNNVVEMGCVDGYLISLDSFDTVNVWDVNTHNLLFTKTTSKTIRWIDCQSDMLMLQYDDDSISGYSIKSQKVLWTRDCSASHKAYYAKYDENYLFGIEQVNKDYNVFLIDCRTGEEEDYFDFSIDINDLRVSGFGFTKNHRYMCLIMEDVPFNAAAFVYDMSTGTLASMINLEGVIPKVCMLEDKIVIASLSLSSLSASTAGVGWDDVSHYRKIFLTALDCNTMETSTTVVENYAHSYYGSFKVSPDLSKYVFFSGSTIYEFRSGTNEQINRIDALDEIMSVGYDDNQSLFGITKNGYYVDVTSTPFDQNDVLQMKKVFQDDIEIVLVDEGSFYIKSAGSNQIFEYKDDVFDKNFTEVDIATVFTNRECVMVENDGYYAIMVSRDEGLQVKVVDSDTDKVVFSDKVTKVDWRYEFGLFPIDDGFGALFYKKSSGLHLMKIILKDGEFVNEDELLSDVTLNFGYNGPCCGICLVGEGRECKVAYYSKNDDGNICITLYDGRKDEYQKYEIDCFDFDKLIPYTPVYLDGVDMFLCSGYLTSENCFKEGFYSVKDNEMIWPEFPSDWIGTVEVTMSVDNKCFAVSDGNYIIVFDENSDVVETLYSYTNLMGMEYSMDGKYLFVVYCDGSVCEYSTEDYSLVNKCQIDISSVSAYQIQEMIKVHIEEDEEHGLLYVDNMRSLCIVDMDMWYQVGVVENGFFYHREKDRFFVKYLANDNTYHIGYFERYELEDLVDIANAILDE